MESWEIWQHEDKDKNHEDQSPSRKRGQPKKNPEKFCDNEDQNHGIALMRRAMESPLRQIVKNAGGESSVVVDKVRSSSGNYGYNAANNTNNRN